MSGDERETSLTDRAARPFPTAQPARARFFGFTWFYRTHAFVPSGGEWRAADWRVYGETKRKKPVVLVKELV